MRTVGFAERLLSGKFTEDRLSNRSSWFFKLKTPVFTLSSLNEALPARCTSVASAGRSGELYVLHGISSPPARLLPAFMQPSFLDMSLCLSLATLLCWSLKSSVLETVCRLTALREEIAAAGGLTCRLMRPSILFAMFNAGCRDEPSSVPLFLTMLA